MNVEHDNDSDTSMDSITEELEQVGRLNLNINYSLPRLSSYINTGYFGTLPNFDLRNISKISDLSQEINRFVQSYIGKGTEDSSNGDGSENGHGDGEESQVMVNSIKTIISTRIQMNKILSDLNLGLSISSAIERLQPLKDVIHEMIILPVEGDQEDDQNNVDNKDNQDHHHGFIHTEPQGIEAIITKDKPYLNDVVIPEEELAEHQSHHSNLNRRRRRLRSPRRYGRASSTGGTTTGSDLDIEGLTLEETTELTSLESLDDFYKESLLRNKIQTIQNLDSINQMLKNKLVTRLMMGNYYKYVNEQLDDNEKLPHVRGQVLRLPREDETDIEKDDTEDEEEEDDDELVSSSNPVDNDEDIKMDEQSSDSDQVILSAKDQEPSYFDKGNNILGCNHYQTNCKVECPTCLKWFPCRFCHDNEIKDHKLVRNEIKHVLCMHCTTPQIVLGNYCIECGQELANYFCSTCKLYDNDYNKDIYHCDKCGICRLGLGLGKDYFHCDRCNICLSIDLKANHKCVSNTTHCNCPICNEYLFTSVSKVVFMKCGHLIHESCYNELTKHSYKCPICKKTVLNMDTQFRILDQEIIQQPLPMPYKNWRCIISCNDCKGKSNISYHVLGLKCKYCDSYNTSQLKLIKPEEELEPENLMPSEPIDRMKLVQTNLSSNFVIDEVNKGYEGDRGETDDIMDADDDTDDNNDQQTGNDDNNNQQTGYDDNDYDSDCEREIMNPNDGNLVDIQTFTNKLLNKPNNNEVSYITSLFQKYINNTVKEES